MQRLLAACAALLVVACGDGSGRAAAPVASAPTSPVVPRDSTGDIEQFGEDNDRNGVPDRLDAYVLSEIPGPETRRAATDYYRLLSSLSARALAGDEIKEPEKQEVFRVLRCYTASARAEGIRNRPTLDNEFERSWAAYNGLRALMAELNGTVSMLSFSKEEVCAK